MFPFENYGDHYGFQRRELLACSQSGRPWLLQAVGTAKAMRELWPGASLRFVGVIPAVSGGRLTGDLKAEFYRVLESRLRERDPNVSDKEIAARTDSGMADAVRIQHSADLMPSESLCARKTPLTPREILSSRPDSGIPSHRSRNSRIGQGGKTAFIFPMLCHFSFEAHSAASAMCAT